MHCGLKLFQCTPYNRARSGYVEPLEASAACTEDGPAVQPEFRLLDDEALQFGDRQVES